MIVVARGGGSVEDLLPFSDEAPGPRRARGTRTPVVSAIGHEPDTPLLDLVADVRASTPTDAAKRVVPDVAEELKGVELGRATGCGAMIRQLVDRESQALAALRARPALADPRSLLDARSVEVADLRDRARRAFDHALDRAARRRQATSAPGPGRCRRWPRSSGGTPWCSTPAGDVVTSVGGVTRRDTAERPGGRRPDRRDHHRRGGRPIEESHG